MKVILQQDVAKIGRKHEIVEVPSGYALNKLIPQGMAKEATQAEQRRVNQVANEVAEENQAANKAIEEAVAKLGDGALELTLKANENGHLFEAVKPSHIVDAMAEHGVSLKPEQVHISTPIKEVGTHQAQLVAGGTEHQIKVEVKTS